LRGEAGDIFLAGWFHVFRYGSFGANTGKTASTKEGEEEGRQAEPDLPGSANSGSKPASRKWASLVSESHKR